MAFLDSETYLTARLQNGKVTLKIGGRAEVTKGQTAGKSHEVKPSKELEKLLKAELEKYEESISNAAKAAAFQAYSIGVQRGRIKEVEAKQ